MNIAIYVGGRSYITSRLGDRAFALIESIGFGSSVNLYEMESFSSDFMLSIVMSWADCIMASLYCDVIEASVTSQYI